MSKKILLACFIVCVATPALAEKTWFSVEDTVGAPLIVDTPPTSEVIEVCGPDCAGEVVVEVAPSIGNKHAVVHGELAKLDNGQSCRQCHTSGGEAVVSNYTMLCSQWPFVRAGLTIPDPVTGLPAKDPVSGTTIVSGDGIAVLAPGDTVLCTDCHYAHRRNTDGQRERVEDFMVHAGCLGSGCHRNVGGD